MMKLFFKKHTKKQRVFLLHKRYLAIPAALLAFVLGSLVDLVQRQVVPKGMRKGGDKV